MKKLFCMLSFISAVWMLSACASRSSYHNEKLPDPKGFNAHFSDMDADSDDLVSWQEFKNFFPQAPSQAFQATDLNEDGSIDHDEWHQFKAAHGLEHRE